MDRPELTEIRDSQVFRDYYYLLSELKNYCKYNSLPTSGGKQEISDRIAHFIDTREILRPSTKRTQTKRTEKITLDSLIEPDIKCSDLHREFFKGVIGKQFTFKVAFQNWLKQNAGKTYEEAIEAYHAILKDAKDSPTVISKQFEYNTYIRAIHADNPGMNHKDAIACWNHKKSQPGHNKYERTDLAALRK
ncbi:SAP domain-containing protein [Christensenellaceae bacterium OttesenSCG-928-K19]|nr:SAP domain-containing protein [Christensenellaceae bacterium OttesenSCG-928-K19]